MISASHNDGAGGAPLADMYDDLRRLACTYLSRQSRDHTLQPTALVHEAYLRLVQQDNPPARGRTHCFCLAAKAMRSVLVDHARRRKAAKRGGGARRVPLDDVVAMYEDRALNLLVLDEALNDLAALDPQLVRIVEMRFFGGLTEREIAGVMGVSERTVRREWSVARMWLFRCLGGSNGHDP